MFHIQMVVEKNEYLYVSIFVGGCRYLKECPRVILFVSISSPCGCCMSTILLRYEDYCVCMTSRVSH